MLLFSAKGLRGPGVICINLSGWLTLVVKQVEDWVFWEPNKLVKSTS